MRVATIFCILFLALVKSAYPQGEGEKAKKQAFEGYSSHWLKPSPSIALSKNADGTITGRLNGTFTEMNLNGPRGKEYVETYSLAPTLSVTDDSKTTFLSGGSKADSTNPDYGVTTFSVGLMTAYSRLVDFSEDQKDFDRIDTLVDRKKQNAYGKCKEKCDAENSICQNGTDTKSCQVLRGMIMKQDNCASFIESEGIPYNQISTSDFCTDGRDIINAIEKEEPLKTIEKNRLARLRFPKADFSLWGGVGGGQFNYYQQEIAAAGSTPATYASKNTWKPNWGLAFQYVGTDVPQDRLWGWTFEVPLFLKGAYQASKKNGIAGTSVGTLDPGGATITASNPAQPIGAPSYGYDLTVEAYLGVVEAADGYWRAALGGGLERNFVTNTNTWSIKLPIYVNATALGGSGNSGKAKDASKGGNDKNPGFQIDYDGIVRLVPTLQYVLNNPGGGQSSWSFLLAFELLGQRTLFSRADNLVK